jgi:EmrB/QacA subfamily drug resistance transporter
MSETKAAPDPRRWKALALLCASFFMVILDSAIVIVALPSIDADLGFAAADLQWILSAYALTFGGLLLLGGRAADLIGRRRVFMLGLGFFTAASLLCALAWSPGALIAARAIQGVGAAVMTPTALSIVMTTFEEGAERNKALGIWGSLGGIGGTAGWLIGGPLTDVGWEWIFLINLPVGALCMFLAPRLLRDTRGEHRSGFDPLGAVSVTAALVLAVYAVVEAPDLGWSDGQTIALFAASAALFAVFAAIESRVVSPLLPLRILRSRTLVGANLVMFLFSAIAFGMPFVLTLYVQQVLGYSPVEFGLTSIVFPLAAAGAAIAGQGLVIRLGVRPLAAAGLVLLGIAVLYLAQASPGGSYFGDVFLGLLIGGAGTGLTFVTCSIAALAGVPERDAGLASGLSNTTFQIGGAVGTAIVSTVVVSRTDEAAGGQIPNLAALTEGFQAGFLACIAFAVLGLLAVIALLGRGAGKAATPEAIAEAPARA